LQLIYNLIINIYSLRLITICKQTNLKGTVRVMFIDPLCKDVNPQFATVPFKFCLLKVLIIYQCL